MIDESNPAGRLYKILSDAKKRPDQEKIKVAWAAVLGVEQDDVVITKAVIELHALSNEIQSLIKLNERLNHDLYLKSFSRIDRVFFPLNLAGNWSTVKGYLTEEALTRLQFCAHELSLYYAEETLSDEDLAEIVRKIDALFESVHKSSFPDILKLSILNEVERLRRAINMYRIRGAKGLKEAFQGAIGAVVANQYELKVASKQDSDVLDRLGELIDKLDSFTARALKLNKILTRPIQYLLEKITEPEVLCDEAHGDNVIEHEA